MVDGRHATPGCLDSETLAAFMDNRLEPRERAAVEAHLAECGNCYEVWMEAMQGGDEVTQAPMRSWSALRTVAAVLLIGFAAGGYWWSPGRRADRAIVALASGLSQQRVAYGRVAGFDWTLDQGALRGSADSLPLAAREAIVSIDRLAEGRDHPRVLHAAGLAALARGDLEASRASLRRALEVSGNDQPYAVLSDMAAVDLEAWRRSERAEDAAAALDAAERSLLFNSTFAPALFNKALALTALGQREQARIAWTAYLQLDTESSWATEAREHLSSVGIPQQPGTSAFWFLEREVIPQWARSNVPLTADAETAASRLVMSGSDRWLGDVLNAIRTTKDENTVQCLRRALIALDDWQEAFEAGGYERTQALSRTATAHLECAGLPSVRPALLTALLDLSRGNVGSAEHDARRLQASAAQLGYWREAALAAQIQGTAALQATRYSDAVDYHTAAVSAAFRSGDPEVIAVTRANLATALASQGARSEAWETLVDSAAGLDGITSVRRKYQTLARAASLAEQSGLWGASLSIGRSITALAETPRRDWAIIAGHLLCARAYANLGRAESASDSLAEARAVALSIADEEFKREALTEVALTSGRVLLSNAPRLAATAIAEGLTFLENRGNRTRTAALRLQQGRALRAAGDIEGAQSAWRVGVDLLEDQRLEIRDDQLRIARTSDMWELFDELVLSETASPRRALSVLERGHARELLDSMALTQTNAAQAGLDSLDWLPDGWTVVAYLTTRDKLLIWTITADNVELIERPVSSTALNRLIASHRTAIRNHRPDDSGLGEVLLPNDISLSPVQPLVIVPDASINDVAFPSLPVKGRPLIELTQVVQVPSLEVLRHLLERPVRPFGKAIIIAAGDAGPVEGFPLLRWADAEASAVHDLYPRAILLRGASATPETVSESLSGASFVAFSGHAVTDTVRPSDSYLLVHSGSRGTGRLMPGAIAAVPLAPGALVVLAACDTAKGQVFRGEGSLTMARPFLIAGASSVMAALWTLSDRTAFELLADFHRRYATGDSPAAALAAVQRDAINRGVPAAAWAGLTIIGRT